MSVVLSSEDEEDMNDEEECPKLKTPQQSPRQGQPTPEEQVGGMRRGHVFLMIMVPHHMSEAYSL